MVVAIESVSQAQDQLAKSDVHEEFYKASGAGGQHRNKTQSAVKLTHKPTGLTAISADERSQYQNRELAWKRLSARVKTNASALEASHRANTKAEQFRLDEAWTWVAYADEVRAPNGNRSSMKRALKGHLEKLLS